MIRLNLPKAHCRLLSLHASLEIQEGETSGLIASSLSLAEDGEDSDAAFFGSRYTINENTHIITGVLGKDDGPNRFHLHVQYMLRDIERPPRSIKSVDTLITGLESYAAEIEVECTVRFRYDTEDGWISRVPLPFPIAIGEDVPFTHVDSARLSKRLGSKLQYSVNVSQSSDGRYINHRASFDMEVAISKAMARPVLARAESISHRLITKNPENI